MRSYRPSLESLESRETPSVMTYVHTPGTQDKWSDTANWRRNDNPTWLLPSPTDDVVLTSGAPAWITVDSGAFCRSIRTDNTWANGSGSLAMDNGGFLTIGGTDAPESVWNGGSLTTSSNVGTSILWLKGVIMGYYTTNFGGVRLNSLNLDVYISAGGQLLFGGASSGAYAYFNVGQDPQGNQDGGSLTSDSLTNPLNFLDSPIQMFPSSVLGPTGTWNGVNVYDSGGTIMLGRNCSLGLVSPLIISSGGTLTAYTLEGDSTVWIDGDVVLEDPGSVIDLGYSFQDNFKATVGIGGTLTLTNQAAFEVQVFGNSPNRCSSVSATNVSVDYSCDFYCITSPDATSGTHSYTPLYAAQQFTGRFGGFGFTGYAWMPNQDTHGVTLTGTIP